MGQSHNTTMTPTRVLFNEKGDNGLVLCDKYIPSELLVEIFCNSNLKTLLNCQLVCQRWKMLIQSYVWPKKVEMTLGKPFPRGKNIPWGVFYLICKKKPFERNLIKNHSGGDGVGRHWQIISQGGDQWAIENPPQGVPELPMTESVFEGKQNCFVTSYHFCFKTQQIDLIDEGFTPYVLDVLQPPIEVSEWYSCRWDCPAVYECQVRLLRDGMPLHPSFSSVDVFQLHDNLEGEKQNKWFRASHVFENYGTGVRKINFCHGGIDRSFWAGHYGSKMAGACVYVRVPPVQYTQDDLDTPPILDE
ncbi:PREDICTED: F-box only protein 44-like [Dinoponera quadriceps]|uniref:F-box only protein 44-like n=1 Tax=Dinoponera quadriceps TaxID=609295 RepID=A0A6P3XTG1_DINQU|nr:PREDICTED: F-box only protein 44-like [Dinoponera quadriceps]XP_014481184.1 PREDICTED: F-box only protein 44-like [Dinoponera quadriceps]